MLDTEALLRPIREDAPTGDNLRADPSPTSPYYQIKDARNAARVAERATLQSEDPMAAPPAEWQTVAELAPKILTEVSKDIEVAVWYIEALLRQEGFAGLLSGLQLTRGLVEQYWDALHPLPDEDGLEVRIAPLVGLNGDDAEGTLIVPIGMVPLLADDEGFLSEWHFKMAREVSAIVDPEAKQRRLDAGAFTMDRVHAAVAASRPDELFATLDEVEACVKEWGALSEALDARCGGDSPPTSNIRHALHDVLDCLKYLTKDLQRSTDTFGEAPAEEAAAAEASAAGAPAVPTGPGIIATRSDAIEAMRRAGDFFRKTEPHSPLSYIVDQALRWAQMPLHMLVSELIPDPDALAQFQLRTGIPGSSSSEPNE